MRMSIMMKMAKVVQEWAFENTIEIKNFMKFYEKTIRFYEKHFMKFYEKQLNFMKKQLNFMKKQLIFFMTYQ